MADHERYRLRPGIKLLARSWGDECVIRDEISGDTSLLSREAFCFLKALASKPAVPAPAPPSAVHSVSSQDETIAFLAVSDNEPLSSLVRIGLVCLEKS